MFSIIISCMLSVVESSVSVEAVRLGFDAASHAMFTQIEVKIWLSAVWSQASILQLNATFLFFYVVLLTPAMLRLACF